MKFSKFTVAVVVCCTVCSPTLVLSQESEAKEKVPAEIKEAKSDEQLSIAFIEKHHPELSALLEVLKTTDLAKYDAAIKDVSKAIKRLEGARKRDEKLYELEIAGWKIQSKIDLLLAKGMAKDKSFKESDLKKLVENRIDNQIQRTNREIELIDQRKASLAETLNKLNNNRQSQVDKQHANLLKRLKGDKTKVKSQEP
ncbi:MAG: hypothetical protein MUC83_17450 [Pirellula sp.]|jgi:hypothetical protein|nr:hypothetical protein [Pirellula sp.]